MGRLVDGKWVNSSVITSDKKGSYERIPRSFRDTVSKDHPIYKPESGRYHLYVSYACPWAHRTLIYRNLKDLEAHITVSVVSPDMGERGWSFDKSFPGATGDPLHEKTHLHEIYQMAQSDVSTSVTVPILWDKKTNSIVNNESSEIIRIFNKEFNELTGNHLDLYPEKLTNEIDSINEWIYSDINNGVYRTGFARTQEAYDEAAHRLKFALDKIEKHLKGKDFLVGNQLTEADIRLLPTLLRYDLVYYVHFKCSFQKMTEFKNIWRYLKKHFDLEAVRSTTNFDHIVRHYYYSHESINPFRIIPKLKNPLLGE